MQLPVNIELIKNPLNWITVIMMLLIAFIIFNLISKCTAKHLFSMQEEN